jgi:small conductance mechanosensitive channel
LGIGKALIRWNLPALKNPEGMNIVNDQWEHVLFAISVLAVAFVITRIQRYMVGRFFKAAAKKLKVDHTRYNFFKNAIDFIIFLAALIIIFRSIPSLSIFGSTLFAGAGIAAVVVGFASQSAFSNIISGIFLVIFKPFSVGDRIKVGQNYSGDVEDITLRHTVIRDFENKRIVIPNNIISNETIVNATLIDEKVCMFVELTITFESDINKTMAIMMEEAVANPLCIDNRSQEETENNRSVVTARVIGFSDLGVQLRGDVWARNATEGFELKCALYKTYKERFDREGIVLAFPHRMIINKNAESLS